MEEKQKNKQEAMERCQKELYELNGRIYSLKIFMTKPEFKELDHINQTLLEAQYKTMVEYSTILGSRLKYNQTVCENCRNAISEAQKILNKPSSFTDRPYGCMCGGISYPVL